MFPPAHSPASPEPGPACQLWFYVKFEDGEGEWLKIPKREDYGTRQEYQRMLTQEGAQFTMPDYVYEGKLGTGHVLEVAHI